MENYDNNRIYRLPLIKNYVVIFIYFEKNYNTQYVTLMHKVQHLVILELPAKLEMGWDSSLSDKVRTVETPFHFSFSRGQTLGCMYQCNIVSKKKVQCANDYLRKCKVI